MNYMYNRCWNSYIEPFAQGDTINVLERCSLSLQERKAGTAGPRDISETIILYTLEKTHKIHQASRAGHVAVRAYHTGHTKRNTQVNVNRGGSRGDD